MHICTITQLLPVILILYKLVVVVVQLNVPGHRIGTYKMMVYDMIDLGIQPLGVGA